MIDPLTWTLIGVAAAAGGFLAGYFWDDLVKWASKVLGKMLDGINRAIVNTTNAIVSVIKTGKNIYKVLEFYSKNTITGKVERHMTREEIPIELVPPEFQSQLEDNQPVKVGQRTTS